MEPTARWKDLCLDAVDQRVVADFWAAALDLRASHSGAGPMVLEGAADHETVWVNAVAAVRPVGAKRNRLHLDVLATSIGDLEALGATVLLHEDDTGWDWTVMADPEGGEFCAFVSRHSPRRGLLGIGIDCLDPAALAAWWGEVLGVAPTHDATHDVHTLTGATPYPAVTLDFAAVPEPRVGPNRVHWDLYADPRPLLDAGASHLWDTDHWTVLADPEGNEFCCFRPD